MTFPPNLMCALSQLIPENLPSMPLTAAPQTTLIVRIPTLARQEVHCHEQFH